MTFPKVMSKHWGRQGCSPALYTPDLCPAYSIRKLVALESGPSWAPIFPGMEHKLHEAAALAVQQGGLGAPPVVLHQSEERSSFILNINI